MSAAEPKTLLLEPGETMPNSPLPVLIYRGVLGEDVADKAGKLQALFEGNGWRGIWRDGVYDYDHFHPNSHEVLGIARGFATLQLGGESGKAIEVRAGDVVVLPAGTGHRRNSESDGFLVIGGYPPGQERAEIVRTRSPEAELRIAKVAKPETDPVLGTSGGLPALWR
jgi:uncharacterized protein YjlB